MSLFYDEYFQIITNIVCNCLEGFGACYWLLDMMCNWYQDAGDYLVNPSCSGQSKISKIVGCFNLKKKQIKFSFNPFN